MSKQNDGVAEMDIYERICAQQDDIVRNGGTPKWISFNRDGYNELMEYLLPLYFDPGVHFSPSKIEEFLGLPVILNSDQRSYVKVLVSAENEYLYPNIFDPNWKSEAE